jgi:E3 ubiquitin-protein ligase MARCH6
VEPAEQWNLEELTWERMLGLDGSFVFLEHVFWVVSLNTLFIFVFAYTPYHVGRSIYSTLHILSLLESSQIAGGLFTLTGFHLAKQKYSFC